MACQPLILERDRDPLPESRPDGVHPGTGLHGLLTFVSRGVDRQTHDEPIHLVRVDQGAKRRCVGHDVSPAPDRRQRPSADARTIGDGDPDPPLPEVDAEDRAHGAVPPSAVERTSTRASSVGIVLTQSGQTDTSAAP
jgi:hypothetical protein